MRSLQLLHVVEAFVVAVEGDELVVLAAFDYLAFVEDVDNVGVLDGGETVCDGDGGAALHEAVEGFLYEVLALGVEGGSGFVKYEYGRILQYGAGDADALTLST